MTEHAVVIVGAGPTGMMVAGELALAGIDAAVVERRPDRELVGQRALGFSARTIEVFDQRGIADRFLDRGKVDQINGFAWIRLDMSDLPTRHNYGLGLAQQQIELVLADWIGELGVPVHRGREVAGFAQDETGVDIVLSDGKSLRAQGADDRPAGAIALGPTELNRKEPWWTGDGDEPLVRLHARAGRRDADGLRAAAAGRGRRGLRPAVRHGSRLGGRYRCRGRYRRRRGRGRC